MQFLQHDGYIETAREFADEIFAEQQALSNISNAPVMSISVRDNEDAYKRQRKHHPQLCMDGSTLRHSRHKASNS
jgi:hypothetical protein